MQRPWNHVPEVVYSLCTRDATHGHNYNICTYVVPVSMKPKRYLIALDPTTRTWHNAQQTDKAVLQILTTDQTSLIRKFGKQTGHKVDKTTRLQTTTWCDHPVLPQSLAWMHVQKVETYPQPNGDHDLFVYEVLKWKYQSAEAEMLTTRDIFGT